MTKDLVLIVHDIRSTHNVGSLLRTADAMSVSMVYFTGYTPYPRQENDQRLPYLSEQISKRINKTSLGAEKSVTNEVQSNIFDLIDTLKKKGYAVVALEQTEDSIELKNYKPTSRVALIVGNELSGLENKILNSADKAIQIPMLGKKESLNVSVAGAIALYSIRYQTT